MLLFYKCVLALTEALLTGMGVSVHTLAPLLVTTWLVKKGVRDVQKKNGPQISADAKWKGSGYNSKGKHIHTCFHLHFEGKQSLIIGWNLKHDSRVVRFLKISSQNKYKQKRLNKNRKHSTSLVLIEILAKLVIVMHIIGHDSISHNSMEKKNTKCTFLETNVCVLFFKLYTVVNIWSRSKPFIKVALKPSS